MYLCITKNQRGSGITIDVTGRNEGRESEIHSLVLGKELPRAYRQAQDRAGGKLYKINRAGLISYDLALAPLLLCEDSLHKRDIGEVSAYDRRRRVNEHDPLIAEQIIESRLADPLIRQGGNRSFPRIEFSFIDGESFPASRVCHRSERHAAGGIEKDKTEQKADGRFHDSQAPLF